MLRKIKIRIKNNIAVKLQFKMAKKIKIIISKILLLEINLKEVLARTNVKNIIKIKFKIKGKCRAIKI